MSAENSALFIIMSMNGTTTLRDLGVPTKGSNSRWWLVMLKRDNSHETSTVYHTNKSTEVIQATIFNLPLRHSISQITFVGHYETTGWSINIWTKCWFSLAFVRQALKLDCRLRLYHLGKNANDVTIQSQWNSIRMLIIKTQFNI